MGRSTKKTKTETEAKTEIEPKAETTRTEAGCAHPRAHGVHPGVMRCPDCRVRYLDAAAEGSQPPPLPPGAVERLERQVADARRQITRARHDPYALQRWMGEHAARERRLANARAQ